ncbi:MAG: anaerobic ribonucleoside triphosphate reductase [Oscillospiraceae bacterium]|jgi:ribonucleoside-triphosphate reductase|nr:anaerobic ribonucleoside triphosphate reductase [Oscillospiraceae bacterium]
MLTKILKRDGRHVPFNIEKIADAIYKAARAVGGHDYESALRLAEKACELLEREAEKSGQPPSVEEVQDVVEKVLIDAGHAKTAKAYIIYRSDRTRVREMNTKLMRIYEDLTFKPAIDCDIKRENANIDGDTAMGTMLKYGSEGAKQFYEMYLLMPEHSKAHSEGDIHIHDLDFFTLTTTCCQIDLIKLFKDGFSTGHGYLREPNNIASYSALACIAIQSNQNDQHGGQSIPNFDYALAEGVRKSYLQLYKKNILRAVGLFSGSLEINDLEDKIDAFIEKIKAEHNIMPSLSLSGCKELRALEKPYITELAGSEELAEKIQDFTRKLTEKETERATYQAMEALVHNLNTMNSRAGAQTPFSSINYGTDTSEEGRMVIRNILLANESGLGNGETPIFPIHVFKIKEGISYNPGDPNYDLFKLACRVSAKRLYPNFSFLDAPFNLQFYKEGDYDTEVAYMGCRTRVIANRHDPTRQTVSGRGNLSFTSINLPRIGIISSSDLVEFFKNLEEIMNLAISQLMYRFKIQCQKKVKNFPFLMGQGVWMDSDKLRPDDSVEDILKHGTLALGYIGLAECLCALIGEHHGESEKAQELGLRIIKRMRDRLDEEGAKTGLNFTLLATPAEGLCGRFLRMDKKRFGVIKGITDHEYYTNSFHVPVYFDISAYDKIKLEAPYHALNNAGHITFVEMDGNPTNNLEAFEKILRLMKESGIGYGSINHPVDRDPVCGYTGVIGDRCPKCNRLEYEQGGVKFERIRRITGYLAGTIDRFNNAKRAEEQERLRHDLTTTIE